MKFISDMSKGILGEPDPLELWTDIVSHIPDSLLTKPGVKILNVGSGYCTEADIIAKRMMALGVAKQDVLDSMYLLDKYQVFTHRAIDKKYTNVIHADFINWETDMKFDVIIGNPPFNRSKDSTGGTGGNSRLYLHFREKALDLLVDNGLLSFIAPKNIVKTLYAGGNQIEVINLMTEEKHWIFNTLYYVEKKAPRVSKANIKGGIAAKIFGVNEWSYNEFNRTENRVGTGNITAVVEVAKEGNNFKGKTAQVRTALPAAPRFGFSLLESKKSYIVTDLPFCASMAGCITLDSMDDAEAMRKMIVNNKGLRFFFNAMNLKGYAKDLSRFTKKVDLSQIKTGFEYPVEWALTPEEINLIESKDSVDKT